tara:strand:+ start:27564 stop:27797 length:234 start_codon:yes stop_codon:yes gene_type:complete
MTYLITYLLISMVIMAVFVFLNEKQLQDNYLKIEESRNGTPSNTWYNFYILTHFLKAPLLFPLIIVLILGNGGKIIK